MNFKSQHTKDMIVNSVWAAAFKNYQENTGETKMTKLGQLYKVKDSEDVYGTFLTTDSQGRFVLEMKGSEAIKAFAEDSLEAVRPYTVAIKFTGPGGSTGYHYIATAGQVEKGDIVIIGGSLAEVVALDTKSEEAVERLEGRKIVTQPL
jgi:NADPH-dependent curcumin reductase CurA